MLLRINLSNILEKREKKMSFETFGAKTLEDLDYASAVPGERVRGKNRQFVRFFHKTENEIYAKEFVQNEKTGSTKVLSTATRPVTKEWVEIITPGDKNTVETIAEDFHKREHMKEYRAFREGRTAPVGKSLDECSYIQGPIATELRIQGVHTEEQLADAPDTVMMRIPNGEGIRMFAKEAQKAKLANEQNPALQALQAQLVEAMEKIKALEVERKDIDLKPASKGKEKNLGPVNLKVKDEQVA